ENVVPVPGLRKEHGARVLRLGTRKSGVAGDRCHVCKRLALRKKALRSNFEPGSPREAVRRAQWKALGLTDDDLLKPKIAVVNSSSELAICFSHLDGIAKVVKEAVRDAGGLPFEVRTAAPSDFIISAGASGGYMLASRDLIVNDMAIAVEGAQ